MSASVSGSWGGQPSTTQPIAGPWLSPQVVTRNRWPKLLWLTPPRHSDGVTVMSGARGFFIPTVW